MQQISFLPGEMTTRERSLIQRALKTLDRHLHEPGVAFTSTRAAREWLILNMAGLEREEFRVLYLNNQNQLIAGETLFTGTINRTEVLWLYRQLENEYDRLTSDAAVDEALLINEYTFTEAGLRAG